jgi:hypothetical protein
MSELFGIAALAVLFVVFGLLRGRVQEGHRCASCPSKDDPAACSACDIAQESSETIHVKS